jgi:hypothetical protein
MNESCPIYGYIECFWPHCTVLHVSHIFMDLWEIVLEDYNGEVFVKRIRVKGTASFADRYPAKI